MIMTMNHIDDKLFGFCQGQAFFCQNEFGDGIGDWFKGNSRFRSH